MSRPDLAEFAGRVSDSGEGRWTSIAAIDEGVPAPVLTHGALLQRSPPAASTTSPTRCCRRCARSSAATPRRPPRLTEGSGGRTANRARFLEGARGSLRGGPRNPPARDVRRRRGPRRAPDRRGGRASTSTTRRTGSPTRPCACWSSSPRSCGMRRAPRGDVPGRSDQRDREPGGAARGPAHAARPLARGRRRRRRPGGPRGARPDGAPSPRGSAAASGTGTPASRSATSSTSGSAARTSGR